METLRGHKERESVEKNTISLSVNIYWMNIRSGDMGPFMLSFLKNIKLFGLITQQTLTIVCRLPCILKQKPCNFSFIWQFKMVNNNFSNCIDMTVIVSCLYSYPLQRLFSLVKKTWPKMTSYVKITSFIGTVAPPIAVLGSTGVNSTPPTVAILYFFW